MAKPTTANASKLTIWVGDGETPEVFEFPCGLTTKGIAFGASTNETNVPDCDDPDAPAWTERVVSALSAPITGSGILAKEALPTWESWFFSAAKRNCRVIIEWDETTINRYDGAYLLTAFTINGTLGNKIQIDVALSNDGQVVPSTTLPTVLAA